MSLNISDEGYNNGKKYGQKGTICGPNIHHISFLLEDIGSFSMRYKPCFMVSVISIFEAFEFVAF
jgi:hypothetical protein